MLLAPTPSGDTQNSIYTDFLRLQFLFYFGLDLGSNVRRYYLYIYYKYGDLEFASHCD